MLDIATPARGVEPVRPPTGSLNLCIIASTYPRHEGDYAVPWMRESIRRLVERGHRVTVLAPSYRGLASHEIDGIPVRRFRYAPQAWERLTHEEGAPNKVHRKGMQALGLPYVALGSLAAGRLALASRPAFDLVHVHWPFPHGPIGQMAARLSKAPLVLNCHGVEFAMAARKSWIRHVLRDALLRGDSVIANSTDTASKILRLSGRDSEVIPYGSTVEARAASARELGPPRILFTGRLIPRKGVQFLLLAAALIARDRDIEVTITGDGDCGDALRSQARELGLDGVVRFLGFVDRERLADEYARCDVWVNPAIIDDRGDTEGLGVGAIEAYSYGKPVVASAVGGIPDAVRHGETGLLVPEKDPEALAAALLDLIGDPDTASRFGAQGLEFARRTFDWDHITDRLEAHYLDVIRSRHERVRSARSGCDHEM